MAKLKRKQKKPGPARRVRGGVEVDGESLRDLRRQLGLKQKDLIDAVREQSDLRVGPNYIYELERKGGVRERESFEALERVLAQECLLQEVLYRSIRRTPTTQNTGGTRRRTGLRKPLSITFDAADASGTGSIFRVNRPDGSREFYVRFLVRNDSDHQVPLMYARLVGVRHSTDGRAWKTITRESHPLNWSWGTSLQKDFGFGEPRYCDLIHLRDNWESPVIALVRQRGRSTPWERSLRKAGKWEFAIEVAPPDHAPARALVYLHWKGSGAQFRVGDVHLENETGAEAGRKPAR